MAGQAIPALGLLAGFLAVPGFVLYGIHHLSFDRMPKPVGHDTWDRMLVERDVRRTAAETK